MLRQQVVVRAGKGMRKITRLEQLLGELVAKAASGDARLMKLVIDERHKLDARADKEPADELGPADKQVMDALYARLARAAVAGAEIKSKPEPASAPQNGPVKPR